MRNYPKINFEPEFPEPLKESIKNSLARVIWLTPLWLQSIQVSYRLETGGDGNGEAAAEFSVYKDYRFTFLTIYPCFLNHTVRQQQEALVHEIIHCFNVPLKTEALAAMDALMEKDSDPRLREFWKNRIDEVMESITQDFSFVVDLMLEEREENGRRTEIDARD